MDRDEIDGRMARMDAATLRQKRIPLMKPGQDLAVTGATMNDRCCSIADKVVPEYRSGNYSCGGVYAKRWQAAYDGARLAFS